MTKKQPRLALIIGSGGLKCAAAIGVMEVLEQENIAVDMVIGCSGGSVFGAAIALGFSPEKLIETRAQAWTKDVTKKVNYSSLMKIAFPKVYGYKDDIAIFDDTIMAKNIENAFGADTTFADTKIPFYCVATDFNTGEPIVLSEGNIAKAVRISSGIPLIFKPIEWNGRLLVDGGLSNPLPIDIAIREGADLIVALGFEMPLQPTVATPGKYAAQMFNILINQLLRKKFAFYNLAHHSEIIAIIPEFEEEIKVNDVEKVPFIIEQGKKETLRHIDYIKRLMAEVSAS